jgi:hypothetical protein
MNVSVGSSSMWKERGRIWTAIAGLGALLAAFALYLALTGSTTESAAAEVPAPAVVDHPNGSELARIRVSQSGIKRLDLRTAQVRSERIDGKARMVVPYSSVIYDSEGETWVYVSSKPRSFMRQQITVDEIVGARVILSAGPKAGTTIATVGAQELWGAELGIDSGSH